MTPEAGSGASVRGSLVGVSLILAFVAIAAATLPRYGITWDEGLGDLYFGDVYLEVFKHGGDPALIPGDQRLAPEPAHWRAPGQPDLGKSTFRFLPVHHWPVSNLVVAAFGEVFDRRLGLLDPIDARHLGIVVLAALALGATWTFARELFGTPAASAATVLLGTYPEFFGLAHNMVKDVGECAFYSWTLIAFYRAHERRSVVWTVAAACAMGFAFGTKLNAAFAAVTLALWLGILALVSIRRWWPHGDVRAGIRLGVVVIAGIAIMFAAWPWLWQRPVDRFVEHVETFVKVARTGVPHWQLFPFEQALMRTPLPTLALFGAGAVALVAWPAARRSWRGVLLLVLWLLVPLGRSTLPGYLNYDGIRRQLEFLPALSIVAGAGFGAVVALVSRRMSPKVRVATACVLLAIAAAPSVWIDVRLHPHQTCYRNRFRGAEAPADFGGSSLREGLAWVNANAVPGASLVAPVAPHLLDVVAPIWKRPDIRLEKDAVFYVEDVPVTVSRPSAGQPRRYVLLLNRPFWSDRVRPALQMSGREVHRIEVDGHPILLVFVLEPAGVDQSR